MAPLGRYLKPLTEQGIIPKLAKIMKHSAHSTLISTDPPITGATWLAIASELGPGKTGVIDFFVREDSKLFKQRFESADDHHRCAYWYLIDVDGGSSGIASYSAVYPPYPIKGFIISEFCSPGDSNIAY